MAGHRNTNHNAEAQEGEVANPNNQAPKNPWKDDIIRISAGAKETAKALEELYEKAAKLQSLADQGEGKQKGRLSPEQVKMYREIMQEIKKLTSHYVNLGNNGRENLNNQRANLDQLIEYQEKLILRARGGDPFQGDERYPGMENRYGDVASDEFIAALEKKLEELINVDSKHLDQLEASLRALEKTLENFDKPNQIANNQAERIDNLKEQNPQLDRLADQIGDAVSGAIGFAGFGQYMGYMNQGVDELRRQEASAFELSQGVDGGKLKDEEWRALSADTGHKNDFTNRDTLALQNLLKEGGATAKELQGTAEVSQRFSRNYGMEPNAFANLTVTLDKAVEIDKNSAKDLANLMGGAINKGGMKGREAEMLRATNTLLAQNTSGRLGVLPQDSSNIVALQTALGEYSKALRGDAGASMLGKVDAGIKNGGQNIDLLLGKGTKYKGPEGLWDLELQKEKGIADPDNLKTIFKNLKGGIGNQASAKRIVKDEWGLSASQVEALFSQEVQDKVMSGDASKDYLNGIIKNGEKSAKGRQKNYKDQQTQQRFSVEARNQERQVEHSKPLEEIYTTTNQLFNALPDPVEHMITAGLGLGGGFMAGSLGAKGLKSAFNAVRPNIGGGGGAGGWFKNLFGRGGGGTPPTGGGGAGGWFGNVANRVTGALGGSTLAKGASALGKGIPFVGGALGVGANMAQGDSLDKALFKGSFMGGALGGMGDYVYDGVQWGGKKIGNGIKSFFGGDKVEASEKIPTATTPDSSSTIAVDNLLVKDKSLADILAGKDSKYVSPLEKSTKVGGNDINVNINIGGKVEGMTKESEKEITKATVNWFNKSNKSTLGLDVLALGMDNARW